MRRQEKSIPMKESFVPVFMPHHNHFVIIAKCLFSVSLSLALSFFILLHCIFILLSYTQSRQRRRRRHEIVSHSWVWHKKQQQQTHLIGLIVCEIIKIITRYQWKFMMTRLVNTKCCCLSVIYLNNIPHTFTICARIPMNYTPRARRREEGNGTKLNLVAKRLVNKCNCLSTAMNGILFFFLFFLSFTPLHKKMKSLPQCLFYSPGFKSYRPQD